MTLDGYHVDVMHYKTWACCIFFVGFVLSPGVARDCLSFKNYITNNLLNDHLFEIREFQHSDEAVEEGYTLLSIVNMMCASLKKYGNTYDSTKSFEEKNSFERVKWTYERIVNNSINHTEKDNTLTACEKHNCSFSYNTSYISTKQLEMKYYNVCKWNGPLPACPSPQNPLSYTPSHTTIHQSMNTESPPTCQPIPSNNSTDNTSLSEKQSSDDPQENKNFIILLLLLLTVSCMVNVALFIVVWWQCRNRHQKTLPDYSEVNQHYQPYVHLLYLRSGEQNSSEEFTFLQKRREQSEDNGISSSPAT